MRVLKFGNRNLQNDARFFQWTLRNSFVHLKMQYALLHSVAAVAMALSMRQYLTRLRSGGVLSISIFSMSATYAQLRGSLQTILDCCSGAQRQRKNTCQARHPEAAS